MKYYAYEGLCLCPMGGELPENAVQAPRPFAPLLYLADQNPLTSRCLCAGNDPEEGVARLSASAADRDTAVLNTAFAHAWERLPRLLHPKRTGLRLTLVGLGDVGGTLLTALKLLGEEIEEIGIYDPNETLVGRYVLELDQVLEHTAPRVVPRRYDALFDCDLFLFTASRGVPPLGAAGDVRMAQLERNREMLKHYAKMARDANFSGLFCQISDPVDLLCRCVFLQSNRDEQGNYDWKGLLPEQVIGFGLGVMAARARAMACRLGTADDAVEVFGPHGAQLVAANSVEHYNEELSEELTRLTVQANHEIRSLGYKPYIAPALSSACISILNMIRGRAFYGAIPMGGVYFGCRCSVGPFGPDPIRQTLPTALQHRVKQAWLKLKEMEPECRK